MPGTKLTTGGSRTRDGVRATADLTAEIAPLLDLAQAFGLPIGDLAGTGSVAVRIEADGPLEHLTIGKLRLAEREIGRSGSSAPSRVRWPVTAAQEIALVVNAPDPTAPVEILSGSVVVPGLGIDELRGRLDADDATYDVTAAGTLDPERLAPILAALDAGGFTLNESQKATLALKDKAAGILGGLLDRVLVSEPPRLPPRRGSR
jgi:hypothetical protein